MTMLWGNQRAGNPPPRSAVERFGQFVSDSCSRPAFSAAVAGSLGGGERSLIFMSMGGPGDHPLTDFLNHGYPVFPADMRPMIRKLHSVDSRAFDALTAELFDWEAGKNLDAGRDLLSRLLLRHGTDPGTL